MMERTGLVIMIVAAVLGFAGPVESEELSIYEIQYSTDVNGTSPQNGNIVDCNGGIVIHKSPRYTPKLTLYDPNHPEGWGGIMAKDRFSTDDFSDVNVGDRVSFTNVLVEDFKGTTFLQYIKGNDANFTVHSKGNPVPEPLPVRVNEIAAPIEVNNQWVVTDHSAEKYEGMLVKVIDVNVAGNEYGKAYDNYVLESNVEPDHSCCWASDYLNENIEYKYNPYVEIGQSFCGVAGIIEQYEGEKEGIYYDYYQLLTTDDESFTIEQEADLDYDCGVDFTDYSLFALHWLEYGCSEPDWCGGADMGPDEPDGIVDYNDLLIFTDNWLEGKY